VVLLSHRGPMSSKRDPSGARTASRGAGGLVTALTSLVPDLPDIATEEVSRRNRRPAEHRGDSRTEGISL
jgi:hypothetical protein